MKKTICMIATLAITLGTSFYAMAADEPLASDSPHRKAAARLVEQLDARSEFLAGFKLAIEPMFTQMQSMNMPADKMAQVRAAADDFGNKVASDTAFTQGLINLYAELYTHEELTQLSDFYETPLGKKTAS